MIQTAHQETPKVALLVGLIAVVFSVVGYQVWSEVSRRPLMPASESFNPTPAPVAADAAPAPAPLIELPSNLVAYSVDPFRKVLPENRLLNTIRAAPPAVPGSLASRNMVTVPPVSPLGGTGFGIVPAGPELHLNGVVFGESSVAVFLLGDRTLFVHTGETIMEGVRVVDISETGVTLRRGKTLITMRIGE